MWISCAVSLFLIAAPLLAQSPGTLSADQLKGDLSFLASDELAGRYTPSAGLNVAAEFIASRFRAAGLKPLADGTYFQTANMIDRELPKPTGAISISLGDSEHSIPVEDYSIVNVAAPLQLTDAAVVTIDHPDEKALNGGHFAGKVVLLTHAPRHLLRELTNCDASLLVFELSQRPGAPAPLLFEADDASRHSLPAIALQSEFLSTQLEHRADTSQWRWSVALPGSTDRRVTLRNVAGIIPGSDPRLKGQVVLLSAHYDHIGTARTAAPFAEGPPVAGDDIYNGANDDGSGTVSVIAIAAALAHSHPRRTILCITFFGEERGLIGSQYYAAHPLFPPFDSVADLNLEQVGRVDNLENDVVTRRPNWLSLTGYSFSNLASFIRQAGLATHVSVYNDKARSDQYFFQSDNYSLSVLGIPSTSISTAFDYPDYHAVGDEWQKIDYANMAHVDRTIEQSVLLIANSATTPHWNAQNAATEAYRTRQRQSNKAH